MRSRCTSPRSKDFADYGGRGIRVCKQWLESFDAFLKDMGPRPQGRHGKRAKFSIDRIDNERGYEPGNCRWATCFEQNQNTRRSRKVEIDGIVVGVEEACSKYGVSRSTFYARMRLGFTPQRALTEPSMQGRLKHGVLHPSK